MGSQRRHFLEPLIVALSVFQLSGCTVCGLGLWTLLEKLDFIQLMTNGTYEVSVTDAEYAVSRFFPFVADTTDKQGHDSFYLSEACPVSDRMWAISQLSHHDELVSKCQVFKWSRGSFETRPLFKWSYLSSALAPPSLFPTKTDITGPRRDERTHIWEDETWWPNFLLAPDLWSAWPSVPGMSIITISTNTGISPCPVQYHF